MAPTRRTRTNQSPAYPPTPPSAEDDEYLPQEPTIASSRHMATPYQRAVSQGAGAAMSAGATPLQRGSACLSCRKRKMKCDGSRPICQQCSRANRSADCEYDDGKTKTRTQLLQEKIHRLEFRLQQLEGEVPEEGNARANAPFLQSPTSFMNQSRPQVFDFNLIPDKSSTDFDFDFGTAASSATRVYDQQQMKRLIDIASSSDPTAGDASWDTVESSSRMKDAANSSVDWQEDGLPSRLRQHLLEIVFPHLSRLGIDLHLPTFLQSLNLPPTHAMRPHPSLLHALYLHACALSPPDHYLHSHKASFAKKCREAISASLEFSDRIIDSLRAQCLLATYYFTVGRTLDGYALVSATARLAVGCELNRIVSPILRPLPATDTSTIDYGHVAHVGLGIGLPTLAATAAASSSGTTPLLDSEGNMDVFHGIAVSNLTHPRKISLGFGTGLLPSSSFAYDTQDLNSSEPSRLLSASYPLVGGSTTHPAAQTKPNPILEPPRTLIELGERILLFWRIFNMDRFWSVACGLQPALSEDEIMTVWPRNMEDYQSGHVNDNEYSSVRSLGVRQPVASTRPDSIATLLSKSITLFERSARLAASLSIAQPPTEAFWVAFRLMEDSIAQLTNCIPPYKRHANGTFESMMGQNAGNISQANSHGPSPTGSTHSDSPTGSNKMHYGVPQHSLGFPSLSSSMPSTSGSAFGHSGQQIEIDETLVLVHILLCGASVQLHNIFAKENDTSYQKAFASARTGAAIIAEVAETMNASGECYDIMLGPCLTLLADVLVREAVRGGPAVMDNLEPELEAVVFVLKAVGSNSSFVARQAALVGAAKDALTARLERGAEQGQRLPQHQMQVPTVLSMTITPAPMLPFGTGAV